MNGELKTQMNLPCVQNASSPDTSFQMQCLWPFLEACPQRNDSCFAKGGNTEAWVTRGNLLQEKNIMTQEVIQQES
jgi:hypothetical protein